MPGVETLGAWCWRWGHGPTREQPWTAAGVHASRGARNTVRPRMAPTSALNHGCCEVLPLKSGPRDVPVRFYDFP